MSKAMEFIINELNRSSEGWHTSLYKEDLEEKGITEDEIRAAVDELFQRDILLEFDDCEEEYYYITIGTDYAYMDETLTPTVENLSVKEFCAQWFGETSRRDWNGITVESIKEDLENVENCKYSAEDVYETMLKVIAEYDEINKEDEEVGDGA